MRITHKISKMNFTKHMGCNNNKNYYTEYFFLLFQYSTDKQKKKKKSLSIGFISTSRISTTMMGQIKLL